MADDDKRPEDPSDAVKDPGLARVILLGKVEAWMSPGGLVSLGTPRQRTVFALLCLQANTAVSGDWLADELWQGAPPATATGLVHTYVARLRRAFTPGAATWRRDGILASGQGRYTLTVPDGVLDVDRLERGLILADEAVTAGDQALALTRLRRTLADWRGELCGGLRSPMIETERRLLSERWLTAKQDQWELELRLGAAGSVTAELMELVHAHPTRERLVELGMLALYRDGRQSEMVELFDRTRRRLGEELGIEPGGRVQNLYVRMLRADPELELELGHDRGRSIVLRPLVPAQLPPDPRWFTGRTGELAYLDALSRKEATAPRATVVAAITGTAGVGKTALAIHGAHQIAHRFPDGQLYVNLRGFDPTFPVIAPVEVLGGFLHALGVPLHEVADGLVARQGQFRTLAATRQLLILLDNVRDADQVRPLLPGSSQCLVIVTSRLQLVGLITADGAQPLPLDLFSVEEARQLLTHRIGTSRMAGDPGAVEEIIVACARLPLALAIVAARADIQSRLSLEALAADLRAVRGRLDRLDTGDGSTQFRTVVASSYALIDQSAAKLFRLLGLHPGPDWTVTAAADLADLAVAPTRRLLSVLTRANLISEDDAGRFTFHDLLREYARETAEQVDGPPQRDGAMQRLIGHYLAAAGVASALLEPFRYRVSHPIAPALAGDPLVDREQALGWFQVEYPNLRCVLDECFSRGYHGDAWRLALSLTGFLEAQGRWLEFAAVQVMGVEAAEMEGDRHASAVSRRYLGRAFLRLRREAEALEQFDRARELHAEGGETSSVAAVHLELSRAFEQRGQWASALEYARRALPLYEADANLRGRAKTLNTIGWLAAQLGDLRTAVTACEPALGIFGEIGDRRGQADALDSLGFVHHHLGDYRTAAHCFRQAIQALREVGERFDEAQVLEHLGSSERDRGDLTSAEAAWHTALVLLDDLEHPLVGRIRSELRQLPNRTNGSCAAAGN